ncbi:MAG: hypothetical protein PVJ39_04710 [Gammaproteobacteria bacterium]|jgi:hypothetical protein
MKFEIDIEDYLSHEEIKDLCVEYVRKTLSGDGNEHHKERVLSNMAYNSAFAIMDEAIDKKDLQEIRNKVKDILHDPSSYSIFRKKDAWWSEDSAAYLEVKKAISKHKHVIDGLVLKAINERDYQKDVSDPDYLVGAIMEIFKLGIECNK